MIVCFPAARLMTRMLGHLTHSGDVETTRLDDGIERVRDAARKYLGQMKCIALPAFDRELHDPKLIAPLHTPPSKGRLTR